MNTEIQYANSFRIPTPGCAHIFHQYVKHTRERRGKKIAEKKNYSIFHRTYIEHTEYWYPYSNENSRNAKAKWLNSLYFLLYWTVAAHWEWKIEKKNSHRSVQKKKLLLLDLNAIGLGYSRWEHWVCKFLINKFRYIRKLFKQIKNELVASNKWTRKKNFLKKKKRKTRNRTEWT